MRFTGIALFPPPQMTYVAQCNLEVLSPVAIIRNPEVGKHFDGFDGDRYLPNSYLRHRFPQDMIE